jgi:chromosome segregation ATPase
MLLEGVKIRLICKGNPKWVEDERMRMFQKFTRKEKKRKRAKMQAPAKPVSGSGTKRSGNVPHDNNYKMQKKIAQLTKVVYFLNTKNEDHATELKSLTDAYEVEIKGIIGEGNEKIEVLVTTVEDKEIVIRANERVIEENEEKVKALKDKIKARDDSARKLAKQIVELETENGTKTREIKEIEESRTSLSEAHESSKSASRISLAERDAELGSVSSLAAKDLEILKKSQEDTIAKLKLEHSQEMLLSQQKDATIAQLEDTTSKMQQRVFYSLPNMK